MWLSDISIRRPVLATVFSIIMVILGLVGLSRLSVREYPDIDPPVVSVTTIYEGASPEVIETTITEPLEDEITSTEGLKTLTSSSSEGVSTITAVFELYRDIDVATQDVRDRVARARQQLPEDVEDPLIVKQDADAQPIMWLGLAGDAFSQLQLTDFADRYIVDRLQTIGGVGRVVIGGQREYAMRLWLDPAKMAARNITPGDVATALQQNNIELPSGRIEGEAREFTIRTLGELKTPEEFNRLIVATKNGIPVYFEDIGTATIGARSSRSLVRMNGKTAVGLGVVKQSKANTLDVANQVKQQVEVLQDRLPKGMTLQVGYDGSKSIAQSLDEVRNSLFQAVALVTLVIFLFLGTFRATLVPVVTIPISLIGVFFVMDMLNYSINTLTLLALVLAIGLVVDDAIVVLETIYRRIEEGDSPMQAAFEGMREIGFAVIATTLVLVAIFVPLTFMGGTVGRLFSEFAIALAGAVVISTLVALSLAPTMCAHMLKKPKPGEQSRSARWTEPFRNGLDWMRERYQRSLRWAIGHRVMILSGTIVILLITALAYVVLPKEFLPTEDTGTLLTAIRAPEGSSMAYTDKAVRKAEAVYAQHPEVDRFFSVIAFSQSGIGNVNEGIMFVTLNPRETGERKIPQDDVIQGLMPKMMAIEEAQVFPFARPSSPTGGFGDPLKLVVQGFDLDQLSRISDEIMQESTNLFGLYNVQNNLKLNKPQLRVHIDRNRANSLGVSVRDVSQTLQILTSGVNITSFQFNSKRYDVMLQAPELLRQTPESLANYYVRATNSSTSGNQFTGQSSQPAQLVPLTSVVRLEETVAPKELPHYDRLRAATISAGIIPIPGISLGGMMDKVHAIAEAKIAPDMQLDWAGESLELVETQSTTQFAFLLAMVMVFLVLAGQFESYRSPFIVILTVPLAVCGALLSLYLFGSSFNTYSQIGIILLVGLATKNGILIVEYANALREANPHWSALAVVDAACGIRFRPIMMTAISTVAGSLPLIFGVGAGAKSRQSLGLAVIGGMAVATLLTLYVLPIIYTYIHPHKGEDRPDTNHLPEA